MAKITGEEWKIMTEKQKAPYEEVIFIPHLGKMKSPCVNVSYFRKLEMFPSIYADGDEEKGAISARNGSL